MGDVTGTYRRLAVLTELESGRKVTQRVLADRLGISLGLANALLRTLQKEGLVRVKPSAGAGDSRYHLTRQGCVQRSKQGYAFAREAAAVLEHLRAELGKEMAGVARGKSRKALLCGSGVLADIVASAMLSAGLKLAGVVSPIPQAGRVAGVPVRPLAEAARIPCDVALTLGRREIAPLQKALRRRVPVKWAFSNPSLKEAGRAH